MFKTSSKLRLLALVIVLFVPAVALAQDPRASLASLPDADVLIYVSPRKILNDAAPKIMPATEVTKMRASFGDMKKGIGIDPSSIEYLVIAVRFHKPAGDLSFVAPDVMAVAGGDFNSDSLVSLAQLSLQDKVRMATHGSKTIALMKIDEFAGDALKNPMLKSFSEVGAVALTPNSIAIGNLPYLKSAIEAADGTGRINPATLESLMRDPNVLLAATGAPVASFAKAFGLFGTETTPRDSRCDTPFGNFYTAITISGTNFSLRGAMNADNADTAQIISGLLLGLMQQGINAVPDKEAQAILQAIKMTPRQNEIVWEADIPEQVVADIFKPKPSMQEPPQTSPAPKKKKPVVRRKRNR